MGLVGPGPSECKFSRFTRHILTYDDTPFLPCLTVVPFPPPRFLPRRRRLAGAGGGAEPSPTTAPRNPNSHYRGGLDGTAHSPEAVLSGASLCSGGETKTRRAAGPRTCGKIGAGSQYGGRRQAEQEGSD